MIKEIAICGHYSCLGGADSELLHQLFVFNKMNIRIHVCHTGTVHPHLKKLSDDLPFEIIYHKSRDWKSLEGMHVISFCNGQFLKHLPEIKKYAKTCTFVNSMTWAFRMEIQRQREGLIDFHLYQTDHNLQMISRHLRNLGKPFRPIRFNPYFHLSDFTFYFDRSDDMFRFGRISRADPKKYHKHQLWVYKNIRSNIPKQGIILGWDKKITDHYGMSEPDISYVKALRESEISQQDFYKFTDVLIQMSDTFENLPRIGFEAMASGSVLVVDNRGGWKIEVDDGVTGFLCNDAKDFVDKSTLLANNKDLRETMRFAAMQKLVKNWGMQQAMDSWAQVFEKWEKLR